MSIVEPKNALSTLYGTKPRRQTKKEFNQISDSPLFLSCIKNVQPQDWTSIQWTFTYLHHNQTTVRNRFGRWPFETGLWREATRCDTKCSNRLPTHQTKSRIRHPLQSSQSSVWPISVPRLGLWTHCCPGPQARRWRESQVLQAWNLFRIVSEKGLWFHAFSLNVTCN